MYYIHDKTRGCVGNSMVWWAENHHGYTCDVRLAHKFTEEELPEYLEADYLVAYSVDEINKNVSYHVDRFVTSHVAPITGESLAHKGD